jgi:lactoylglutathione lyase
MFAAVGIAVSNMEKSRDFYASTLGLRETGMTFNTPQFDEIVMQLPGERVGSAIVLMKWKTPKQTKDLAIKLVFYVEDVKATMQKIKAAGATIIMEPGSGKLNNVTIPTAFAKDPDGYLIELNPWSVVGKGA